MSTTPTVITADHEHLLQRVKSACGNVIFLLIQRSPKFLKLYRNEQSWTLLRIALGCFGAALVVLPLSLWHGYYTAIFGLIFFVLAILLPPAELESPTDRKARELGAKTVVSGGEYRPREGDALPVQLFISPAQVWALDKRHEPVVVVTTAEITSLDVTPHESEWALVVRCGDQKVEFLYRGIFAERFARLAEEALRHSGAGIPGPAPKRRSARV